MVRLGLRIVEQYNLQFGTNLFPTANCTMRTVLHCTQCVGAPLSLTLASGVPHSSPGTSVTSTLLAPGLSLAWVARNSERLKATSRDKSHSSCERRHRHRYGTARGSTSQTSGCIVTM